MEQIIIKKECPKCHALVKESDMKWYKGCNYCPECFEKESKEQK